MNESQSEQMIELHLQTAYKEAGGIVGKDDNHAYEIVRNHLKQGNKIKFENGVPVFVKNDGFVELRDNGQPKTITDKILELKSVSPFKFFFTNSQQPDNSKPKTYSRYDAQRGRVNIDDIVKGTIVLSDDAKNLPEIEKRYNRTDFQIPTKVVNVAKILKGGR